MKINVTDVGSSHQKVLKYIYDNLASFAQEHDVDQFKVFQWITLNEKGLTEFTKWLATHRIINSSAYALRNDDGSLFSLGFDIVEDELFTFMMIKIK